MKLKFGRLSEYIRKNKRFSLLVLVVMLVVIYVGMDIYEDFSLRNKGSELNEAGSELFSNEIVNTDKDDADRVAEENNELAGNEQDYNIYITEEQSSDNGMSGNEAEMGTEIAAENGTDSNNSIITKEEIEAIKEDLAERAARKAAEEAAAAEAEAAEKELEEESEPEPKPVYRPDPKPEPEPVIEIKNIELIVHIHFEDENGKSLSGQVVQITVSQGGSLVGSASSDGQDARISIPAVNSIITGQDVAGFVSEGSKAVSLSGDDSVKHVSYKYRKVVE